MNVHCTYIFSGIPIRYLDEIEIEIYGYIDTIEHLPWCTITSIPYSPSQHRAIWAVIKTDQQSHNSTTSTLPTLQQ
jgi:hypothetical protein